MRLIKTTVATITSFVFLGICSAPVFSAEFPEHVFFKGNKQTFNSAYYTVIHEGNIWVKPNKSTTGNEDSWQQLALPDELMGNVQEIASDDEHILAINSAREIYTMWNALDSVETFRWQKAWGLPFWQGPGHTIPETVNRWDFSVVSPRLDEYYIDPAGNHMPIGDAKVSHIIVLKPDGRNVGYNDPWLPTDWSYEICGPKRGLFPIHTLSASGSTVFAMGEYGDMFTRIYDFDLSGHDDPINYSYEDQSGRSEIPNLPQPIHVLVYATQLPTFPWVQQPKIDGRITDRVSIHKIGKGVVNRILRVEGWDNDGNSGYYEKEMTLTASSDWIFHQTNHEIEGNEIPNKPYGSSAEILLASEGLDFKLPAKTDFWSWLFGNYQSWQAEVVDFDPYCSPASFQVTFKNGEQLTLKLHALEGIRLTPRERGINDRQLKLNGTLEVDADTWNNSVDLSKHQAEFVNKYFSEKRFRDVNVYVTTEYLKLTDPGPKNEIAWEFSPQ